jgi:hypothetical protein
MRVAATPIANTAAAVGMDRQGGGQVALIIQKLKITRQGSSILEVHRQMHHPVRRARKKAAETALGVQNAAKLGHMVDQGGGGEEGWNIREPN